VDCPILDNPVKGQVKLTGRTKLGYKAIYSCYTGYELKGNSTRTCQATGVWSGSEPTCKRMLLFACVCNEPNKCYCFSLN